MNSFYLSCAQGCTLLSQTRLSQMFCTEIDGILQHYTLYWEWNKGRISFHIHQEEWLRNQFKDRINQRDFLSAVDTPACVQTFELFQIMANLQRCLMAYSRVQMPYCIMDSRCTTKSVHSEGFMLERSCCSHKGNWGIYSSLQQFETGVVSKGNDFLWNSWQNGT